MGKKLIIRGADFSENGISKTIEWYSDKSNKSKSVNYSYSGSSSLDKWAGAGVSNSDLIGKRVNVIRTFFNPDGLTTDAPYAVYHVKANALQTLAEVSLVKSFNLTSEDIANGSVIVHLDNSYTIGEFETLFIGYNGNVSTSVKPSIPLGTALYAEQENLALIVSSANGNLIKSSSVAPLIDYGIEE